MTLANADVDSETRRKLIRHSNLAINKGTHTRLNAQRMTKKVNKVQFFAIDTDPDHPIDYTDEERTENNPMNIAGMFPSGSEVQILSPRFGDETQPKATPSGESAPGRHAQGALSTQSTCDAGRGDRTPFNADGATHAPSTLNDEDRPSSQAPSLQLPESDSGLSCDMAPQATPTRSINDLLAEAFSAGVRVGRGLSNGDK